MDELENDLNNAEQLETIKECLERLIVSRKAGVDLSMDLKEIESNLKIDVAEVKNYKKTDGTNDLKKIKMGLLKDAIAIKKLEQENKLKSKFDLLEEYLSDLDSNAYNADIIDTYINKIEIIADNKLDVKDIKDNYTGTLDSDVIKAIDKLSKVVEKEYLEFEKSKLDDASGKKTKSKTVNSTIDELVLILAKKLGIKIG